MGVKENFFCRGGIWLINKKNFQVFIFFTHHTFSENYVNTGFTLWAPAYNNIAELLTFTISKEELGGNGKGF